MGLAVAISKGRSIPWLEIATMPQSISHDLDKNALATFPIEFAVEDLLPRAEIQFSLRDRDHHFSAHNGALQMRVGVVLAPVVRILSVWFFGSQFLQPALEVLMQAKLIVIYEDAGGDVHGIAK